MVCPFLNVQGDKTRLGALSASRGQHGSTMVPNAAGNDSDMTISSFVRPDCARGRKSIEILGQRPVHLALERRRNEANLSRNSQPANEGPSRFFKHPCFRRADSESR